jgi:hypothetical protein
MRKPGSSVSIVSGYGLDDRAIDVRSPAEAKDFSSSFCVQTSSGAHPASYRMGSGVLSQGVKRGGGVTLTTHSHLLLRSRISRRYTFSPPSASMACSGAALLYFRSEWRAIQKTEITVRINAFLCFRFLKPTCRTFCGTIKLLSINNSSVIIQSCKRTNNFFTDVNPSPIPNLHGTDN